MKRFYCAAYFLLAVFCINQGVSARDGSEGVAVVCDNLDPCEGDCDPAGGGLGRCQLNIAGRCLCIAVG